MRKRIASLFLALTLCMGLTVPAFAMTWDTDEAAWLSGASKKDPDFWKTYLKIDGLIDTGYVRTEDDPIANVVCYCKAPARVTLLEYTVQEEKIYSWEEDIVHTITYAEPWQLGSSVASCTVSRDGELVKGSTVAPTKKIAVNTDEYTGLNGAGTYWDLPEGIYSMFSVEATSQLYLVVGDPLDDVTTDVPAAKNDTGATPSFSDVKPSFWCYDSVNWAVEHGITTGFTATTFAPDQTCTHAQILTFLWRASGSPKASDSNPYKNSAITPDKYYYDALLWAWGQELIGYDTFDPNTPCKRSDVVTYLWKLSGSPAVSGRTFSDVPANDVSAGAVAWAVDAGITTGTTATTFSPDRTCTRGHIVTFLYRFFESWEGNDHVSVRTQNELNALPDRVNAEQIKEITAVNAGISDLSALRELPGLTHLQLFFNLDIGSLEPLRGLTELTYLDLSSDGVKDISALSGLKKLTYLDLGGNGTITDLTPLYGLKNLTELNLDFDHITQEQADALQAQLPGCKIKW